jgi:predicted transposase/invertase (TIGR01784 family)
MAVETLGTFTQDEIEYARMSTLIKSELDYNTGMFEAERKGRAEGILEIARKMKKMGEPIEKIQTITGLSTETIEQM